MNRFRYFPQPLSPYAFSFFRMVFGIFLFFHFLNLVPEATQLFSAQGLLGDPRVLDGYPLFPNPLQWIGAPAFSQLFVSSLAVLSLVLVSGWQRRLISLTLAWGSLCLIQRNPWIDHLGIAWIGWLLLALALPEPGEPASILSEKRSRVPTESNWSLSLSITTSAWILFALANAFSAAQKIFSPSWIEGSALRQMLSEPLVRDGWLRLLLLGSPLPFLEIFTWGVLTWQLIFLPLAIFPRTRKIAWNGQFLLLLGAGLLFQTTEACVALGLFTFFLTDERWFAPQVAKKGILYFDGVCGLCNHLVDFLLDASSAEMHTFTPLQGATAKRQLPPEIVAALDLSSPSSVIFANRDGIFEKSEAILRALSALGGVWRLAEILRWIPSPLRDPVYDWIAQNRYRWFGKSDTCRVPTPEEKQRFLP